MRLWFFIYFMLSCYANSLFAQDVPRILNFSKNDYQAQRQNWSITQSPDYELFFGNGNGVLVYDGAVWRTLTLPNQQIVRSVACDNEGRIFAGGFSEFGYFQRDDTGNYQYHSLSAGLTFPKVSKEEIWHILIHQNLVYFQSFSCIYKYDYEKVVALNPPSNIMFLSPIGNRLLIQGLQKGLYELSSQDSFSFIQGSEFLANTVVSTILPYKNGFLVGTTKDGVFKFENNNFSIWNIPFQNRAKDFELNKGVLLSNGNYAFGTILNGIFILNTEGVIQYHINQENGLQNNTVLSMYEDRSQNLWIGLDKGIDLVDLTTPLTFFQDKSGKIGSVYTAVLYNNRLYVGTNQGVFYRNAGEINFKLLKGLQGQAWDLQIFDNQLLCGHNSGTFIIKNDNSIQKISNETGGWCTIRGPSVSEILIQSLYTGLAIYKKNSNGNWYFHKKINGYNEPTKKIAFDEYGNLWALSAYHQLFKIKLSSRLDSAEKVMKMYLPTSSKPFFSRVGGSLLFSNAHTVFNYDNNLNEFKECRLPIIEAQNGKIMSGGNSDLIKINVDKIDIYDENNLSKPFCNLKIKLIPDYETVISLDSNRYLFGLDDGYAIFDKSKLTKSVNQSITPIIRVYTKDGKSFHFYASDKAKKNITLPPQYRELRLSFALPYYTNPPSFSYFLSEHLTEWSEWTNVPNREFANLSAGEHEFKLLHDLDKSIPATTIFFEIKPYWYETIFAQIALIFILISALFWLKKYHEEQLKQQRQKLEAEKKKELEQQRIKMENEKLQSEVKVKSKELANSTMNIIQKNEVLLEIKNELDTMKTGLPEKHYNHLSHLIDYNLTHEESSRIFEDNFNEVHEDFLKRLKQDFPSLTPSDLKLAAFLRMNLSSKEISPLLFISVRTIENKRSRLRKKIGLSETDNLTAFLMQY